MPGGALGRPETVRLREALICDIAGALVTGAMLPSVEIVRPNTALYICRPLLHRCWRQLDWPAQRTCPGRRLGEAPAVTPLASTSPFQPLP